MIAPIHQPPSGTRKITSTQQQIELQMIPEIVGIILVGPLEGTVLVHEGKSGQR